MLRIRPGAARAIEPVRLVHGEQAVRLLDDSLLAANGVRNGFQCAPARGSAIVVVDAHDIVFAHRALHGRDILGCFQRDDLRDIGSEREPLN